MLVKINICFKLENEPSILENTTVPRLEYSHLQSQSESWMKEITAGLKRIYFHLLLLLSYNTEEDRATSATYQAHRHSGCAF